MEPGHIPAYLLLYSAFDKEPDIGVIVDLDNRGRAEGYIVKVCFGEMDVEFKTEEWAINHEANFRADPMYQMCTIERKERKISLRYSDISNSTVSVDQVCDLHKAYEDFAMKLDRGHYYLARLPEDD